MSHLQAATSILQRPACSVLIFFKGGLRVVLGEREGWSTSLLILFNYLPLPLAAGALQFSISNTPPSQPPPLSAVGRSDAHLSPLLSEHWGRGVQWKTPSADHNGRPIISSKRGRGAGWSEKIMAAVVVVGSIHQSISNEGKNWSKSSRWKSCLSLRLGWSFFAACQQAIRLPLLSAFVQQQRP